MNTENINLVSRLLDIIEVAPQRGWYVIEELAEHAVNMLLGNKEASASVALELHAGRVELLKAGEDFYAGILEDAERELLRMKAELMPKAPLPAPMQRIADMDHAQLESEKDFMEETFCRCRECGQGISTKETVQYNFICRRIDDLGFYVDRWL